MNAAEWVKENYPKFAHCEKKPLPHVDYEIISVNFMLEFMKKLKV